jgi:HemY protein
MRNWITIIVVIGALLCAVALAPMFAQDAGYVLIQLGSWTLESNVLVLIGLLLLIMLTLRLVTWFLSLPRRATQNLARRRLEKGLLALAEGDWRQAELALSKSAAGSDMQVASYLAAARAADGQEQHLDGDRTATAQRQQHYLQAADDGHAKTRFLIQLSKARLLINKNQHALAIPILQHCLKQRRRHPQALRMLAGCYRELGHWQALRALLPMLRKTGLLDRSSAADLERLSVINELQSAADADALQRSWDSLLRAQRQQPEIIASYAEQALHFDFPRLAEGVLIHALERQPHARLLTIYASCHIETTERALSRALQWQRQHPDDAGIQRLLGQLYLQAEKWGKARDYFQESLRLQADAATYTQLGKLLEQQGDSHAAANCYYNALQLTTSQAAAAVSNAGSTRPLPAAQLRPIYPAPALSAATASVTSLPADQYPSLQSGSGSSPAQSSLSQSNAAIPGAAKSSPKQSGPTQPRPGTNQPDVADATSTARRRDTVISYHADDDDAVGDMASVPADFRPATEADAVASAQTAAQGDLGAKSKES